MTVYKNISLFDGGFIVDLTSDSNNLETVEISAYELSRNNVKGDKVKCVKTYNYGQTADCQMETQNDRVIFAAMQGGVQPVNIGRGDLKIFAFFASQTPKKFVFYYSFVGNYIFDLVP